MDTLQHLRIVLLGMQYRRAIRRPQPAEREYLAAQSTGTGIHVGQHVQRGWLVDAAMAESPAEEAGIVRGDLILEISQSWASLSLLTVRGAAVYNSQGRLSHVCSTVLQVQSLQCLCIYNLAASCAEKAWILTSHLREQVRVPYVSG